MKLLIDTCVLYPTVMREMVLGVASRGAFTPLWSARILEEWVRAAQKLGPEGVAQAQSERAMLEAAFPKAAVAVPEGLQARLWLPDANDVHVLAAAVASSADGIMTLNARDFPRQTLAEEDLLRVDPDSFLYNIWLKDAALVEAAAAQVLAQARAMSGRDWTMRQLLKKARLPRCAKALA